MAHRTNLGSIKGRVDFGIITIREDEFEAVLARFPKVGVLEARRRYRIRRLPLPDGAEYTIAIVRCAEQGNSDAQNTAHDLIEDIAPAFLLVVGIAGGVPAYEFTLGDTIVCTRIADFSVEAVLNDHSREYALGGGPLHPDAAKLAADVRAMVGDGDLAGWNDRESITMARPPVVMHEDRFYGDDEWKDNVREKLRHHFESNAARPPLVVTGAIASSDRLIKDAELLQVWLKTSRQIQAFEMESAGVYKAAHGRVPFLAIRGISDVVGLKRQAGWTEYACQSAAAFTRAFLLTRPIPVRAIGGMLGEEPKRATPVNASHEATMAPFEFWVREESATYPESSTVPPNLNCKSRSFLPRLEHPLDPGKHFEGRAQELAHLDAWLNNPDSPQRVLSICAIGGTGKTSLVRRALDRWLIEKFGPDGRMPSGLFVWSFYDNERIDEFVRSAGAYFDGSVCEQIDPFERLKGALRSEMSHLLVLDGLERVQLAGVDHRAMGEISDRRLRTLLSLIAGQNLGSVRVLVTSRFPVCDLESWSGRGYSEIRLDDLNEAAARGLLRAWGVNGSDEALDLLGEKVHRHALSIAVLGSYLANFYNGEAYVGFDLNLEHVAKEASDADKKAARLLRLVTHYAQRMPDVERELMVRVCMFPRGLGLPILKHIIDAGGIVAGLLAAHDEAKLVRMLEKLVGQGLAFRYDSRGQRAYTAHPFLRDAFKNLANVESRDIHEAVRQRLAPSLQEQPNESPADYLDRYEALIEHTHLAGKVKEAFELYLINMATPCRSGDYARGARVASGFADTEGPESCSVELGIDDREFLLNEWGYCAYMSGNFRLARRCFAQSLKLLLKAGRRPRSALARNCIAFDTLLGRLPSAIALGEQFGLHDSTSTGSFSELQGCYTNALALIGKVADARRWLSSARHTDASCDLWESELYLRLGSCELARSIATHGLETCKQRGRADTAARFFSVLGRLAVHEDLRTARRYLVLTRDWVAQTGDVEVAVRASLLATEIALHEKAPADALAEATEGLVQADACGLGLYAIDLGIYAASANKMLGDHAAALAQVNDAVRRASHPDCAYAWGRANALYVLGVIHRDLGDRSAAFQRLVEAARARFQLVHPGATEWMAEAVAINDKS